MSLEEKIKEVSNIGSDETPAGRVERFKHLLPYILSNYNGNIVEIGAGIGESTIVFLNLAKIYDRKVLVIDPWEDGGEMPKGYGDYKYNDFLNTVKGYEDHLIIHKKPSSHNSCFEMIGQNYPLSFAFVDGLQTWEASLSDIKMCAMFKPEVICLDDVNRSTDISQVPKAISVFLGENNDYKYIYTEKKTIEGYLIRK